MFSRVCSSTFRQSRPLTKLHNICNSSKSKFVGTKRFMLSAAVMASFDWDQEKSSEKELVRNFKELDYCRQLKLETLTCPKCKLRLRVDIEVEGISYCKCEANVPTNNHDNWVPYLERKDIVVWRKEHEVKSGLYQYRLYGVLNDVSVWEFLAVQLDLSKFRREWDSSTAKVDLVETGDSDDSLVYHWEVNWPTFFSNRDYCSLRQMVISPEGEAVVTSRSCDHPSCPKGYRTHRVKDYKSVLTMRPAGTIEGVEFCLTAFEDQGVQLPESIISWVAMRAMPELINNLRTACLRLRNVSGNQINEKDFPCPKTLKERAEAKNNSCFKTVTEADFENIIQNDIEAVELADHIEESSDKSLIILSELSKYDSLTDGSQMTIKPVGDYLPEVEPKDTDSSSIANSTTLKGGNVKLEFTSPKKCSLSDLNDNHEELIFSHGTNPDSPGNITTNPISPENVIINSVSSENVITNPISSENFVKNSINSENMITSMITDPGSSESISSNPVITESITNSVSSDSLITNPVSLKSMKINPAVTSENTVINPVSSLNTIPNPVSSLNTIPNPVSSPVRSNLLYPGYVEHELELLLYEEIELERELVLLNLRMRELDGEDKECHEAIQSWCTFVSRKSQIFHRKMLLELLGEEKHLENKCLMLQQELRQFVNVHSQEDKHREQLLIEELVMLVNQRDQLVMQVENEENNIQDDDIIRRQIDGNNTKNKCQMQ